MTKDLLHARVAPACLAVLALALTLGGAAAGPRAAAERGASALVGAHVILAPGRELDGATLVIRDGLVEAVGVGVAIPADARIHDATGLVVWPAFIDPHVGVSRIEGRETPAPARRGRGEPAAPPAEPKPPAAGSMVGEGHPRVLPERRVADRLALDGDALAALRAQGFGVAQAVPEDGILRGTGVILALSDQPLPALVIAAGSDQFAAFDVRGQEDYPDSVMGATAVLRQAFLDAEWYGRATAAAGRGGVTRPAENVSLEALAPLVRGARRGGPRLALACRDVLDTLRAGELAQEFGLGLRLVGAGDEYRRLAEVAALGVPVTVPVETPRAPAATDDVEWLDVSLDELRHFDLAADDARFLHEAGVDVSLTTNGLESLETFGARVRSMIERGLSADDALAMLTTAPARLLGLERQLGEIGPGRQATFVVARGRPFDASTEIRAVWIDGRRHVVSREPDGPEGTWQARFERDGSAAVEGRLSLERTGGSFKWTPEGAEAEANPRRAKVTAVRVRANHVDFTLEGSALDLPGDLMFSADATGSSLVGGSTDGALRLSAARAYGRDPDPREAVPRRELPARPGPLAQGQDVLLRGVQAWTCGPAGVLEGVDVLVRSGRIAAIGPGLAAPRGVPVLELAGLHLTPGLIDAHSHAAIVGGVNEGTHSCTAEVRIGDVVNSETEAIYRQLAGGLTTANLLHGSANCMGGQSQVIKLRWGAAPADLKFKQATPAIKFALGENVKQSNWGEKNVTRFPQTRMGVEQFMREKFLEAANYRASWKAAGRARAELPPRRDLQLETLVEILEGRRLVHCHSYRQDEILMLMRVAEELGFRVGTFQHVLEGYKVAEEMARHGAMASTFSDWWGYKFEVYDAIPYNAVLMHERGVVVSLNSDSTELGRRMNLEAAKAVKWGGLPEAEALLMVTLNPARQLGVDALVGSIEVGKDADLVAWTGPPLSAAARVSRTWVDGRLYFDREQDLAARPAVLAERALLIERARQAREDAGASGAGTFRPSYIEGIQGDACMDNTHQSVETQP